MGNGILNLVMEALQDAGFAVDNAYPGSPRKFLEGRSAAVHIAGVDVAQSLVTVGVSVICPSARGGVQCELDATRALKVLKDLGASCVQSGCRYEGMAQAYVVEITASFACVTDGESYELGHGFTVSVGGVAVPWAVSFHAEQVRENQAQFAMGETEAVGVSQGSCQWQLQLEERIPPGGKEPVAFQEPVEIKILRGTVWETYRNCCWTSVQREITREGLHRIHRGIALGWEVD